ncbi:MAG: hypothetical protein ABFD77_01235 [Thermotogota bacterium]
MDKFAKKVIGIHKRSETDFTDEATGLVVTMRELYPGDELELKHIIYRLKPGKDFDEIQKAKARGVEIKHTDIMEMDLAKQQLETLARKIVRWNLTDDAGVDLDISAVTIGKLDKALFDLLEKWGAQVGDTKKEAVEVKN